MKIAYKVNWVLITLLSISTGIFKISQQEADIELFAAIRFNSTMTTILGVIQLLGGVLMIPNQTRKKGAFIMIPTFMIASAAVFANQQYVFGVVSLLFIGMAYFVILMEKNRSLN